MSSVWKSSQSQTPARQAREYLSGGSRPASAKAQHVDSGHPFTHNLSVLRINGAGGFKGDDKGSDFLQTFPDGFGAGMTVVLAAQEASKTGEGAPSGPRAGAFRAVWCDGPRSRRPAIRAGRSGAADRVNSTSPAGSLRASRSHSFSPVVVLRSCFDRISQSASGPRRAAPGGDIDQRPQVAFPIRDVEDQAGVGHRFGQIGHDLVALDPTGAFLDVGLVFGFPRPQPSIHPPSATPAGVATRVGWAYNPCSASSLRAYTKNNLLFYKSNLSIILAKRRVFN